MSMTEKLRKIPASSEEYKVPDLRSNFTNSLSVKGEIDYRKAIKKSRIHL